MNAIFAGNVEDGLTVMKSIQLVNMRLGYTWAQDLWHPGEESAQLHHEQQQGLTLCAIANTYYLSINLIECYCLWDLGCQMSESESEYHTLLHHASSNHQQ